MNPAKGPSEFTKNDSADPAARKRADLYRILSESFYPPKSEVAEKLWVLAISKWAADSSEKFEPNSVELRLEYNRLFVGPNALPCPPYESVYRKERVDSEIGMLMGPTVLDVKKRYNEAGLEIAKSFTDLPDHIAIELEFMCFLCTKESESVASGADESIWRHRQEEFCKLHLEPWIEEFSSRVINNTRSAYYRAAAELLRDWIQEEGEALEGIPRGGFSV